MGKESSEPSIWPRLRKSGSMSGGLRWAGRDFATASSRGPSSERTTTSTLTCECFGSKPCVSTLPVR